MPEVDFGCPGPARSRLRERQIETVDRLMVEALKSAPEAEPLLSIPKLGPATAAVFLQSGRGAHAASKVALDRTGSALREVKDQGLVGRS